MKTSAASPEFIQISSASEAKGMTGLDMVERELQNSLNDGCSTIREMGLHMLSSGGKRIRPQLVLHCGLIFSGLSDALIRAAVAAELIHMATLAHDDIIDDSDLRRNRLSLNKAWSNQFGVLCGDYLFAKAFGILSDNRLYPSLGLMVEAIKNMCSGEIMQANNQCNPLMDLDSYYEQITKKTAVFMACCCQSGAVIGGAGESQVRAAGDYGLNLGLAFQIMDDVLDYCGDPLTMGKPRGEDFRQGILTLPVILLLYNAKYRATVKELMSKQDFCEHDFRTLVELLDNSGAIESSKRIAAHHLEAAKNSLRLLPATPSSDFLYQLTDRFKSRSS